MPLVQGGPNWKPRDFQSRSASPADQSQLRRCLQRLPLLQLSDWNADASYDEEPPTCVRYNIEWQILLKKVRLSKITNDIESNVVLAPGAFWQRSLKAKVEDLLKKKTPPHKCYKLDEINVVVSTSERTERDLKKKMTSGMLTGQSSRSSLKIGATIFDPVKGSEFLFHSTVKKKAKLLLWERGADEERQSSSSPNEIISFMNKMPRDSLVCGALCIIYSDVPVLYARIKASGVGEEIQTAKNTIH